MRTGKQHKLEILLRAIQTARSALDRIPTSASEALGENGDGGGLRTRLEEKLTRHLIEFVDLTECRFHVAV